MVWRKDDQGTEFSGPKAAFQALKERAARAINESDANGVDVRHVRIRVRDGNGNVLFEGTTEEAASLVIDGRVFLPGQP